jgi:hypothetical protein
VQADFMPGEGFSKKYKDKTNRQDAAKRNLLINKTCALVLS